MEGWPRWTENQIISADFVLILNSKNYYEKWYSMDKEGKGLSWELNIIYQHLFDNKSQNTKFIPVYFKEDEKQYIITPLKAFTFYNVGGKEGFDNLYWRLRGVTKAQRPPLGKLRPLPEKEQKTLFFSTPINLEQWDKAQWSGMLYLFQQGTPPILGFVYKDYEMAKTIFNDWRSDFRGIDADEYIEINFIVPPFAPSCWVYSDSERKFGKGYFVHVGANVSASFERATASGIPSEEILLAMISRHQWMDEVNGSQNREFFKEITNKGNSFFIIPVGLKDNKKPVSENNIVFDLKDAVRMKRVSFKEGISLSDDDVCKVVLQRNNKC